MFGNKKNQAIKEENTKRRTNELLQSIEYMESKTMLSNEVTNISDGLIKLLKVICNHLNYKFAYQSLIFPHSTKEIDGWYYPRNRSYDEEFKLIDLLTNPIYIDLNKTAIIIQPWNNERIINNLLSIGAEVNNILDESNSNIMNAYIYPLGLVMCQQGNHSQFSGKLKNEMSEIKITSIIDISKLLDTITKDTNGNLQSKAYYDFEDHIYTEEVKDLFKIGLSLEKFPDAYPQIIIKNLNSTAED